MSPDRTLLPPELAARLAERAQALLPLGSLTQDAHVPDAAERAALGALAERLRATYPYPDARYAGQMLKPPHPVAGPAYATRCCINPNNHALDGGPATRRDGEGGRRAARRDVRPRATTSGHLTARRHDRQPRGALGRPRAASRQRGRLGADAHYTHARICGVLGVPLRDGRAATTAARMDLDALAALLRAGDVGTVVATLGTTGARRGRPVAEIAAAVPREHGVRVHVDAAYGGFFAPRRRRRRRRRGAPRRSPPSRGADSVVIDPHKHGLQPYGCGCVLFRDPGVGRLYLHDSPYTYFTSGELHLGEISLECSRAGASAAALWTTLRALPADARRARPAPGGGPGRRAARGRPARRRPADDARGRAGHGHRVRAARGASAARASAAAERAFATLAQAGWHVALLRVDTAWLRRRHPEVEADAPATTVLRCCLMKQEHAALATGLAAALAAHLADAAA